MNPAVHELVEREAIPELLRINTDVVEQMLTSFVGQEVRKVGFDKVVVGLSGGIDSAVSACLAARALGAEATYAVMMPYRTSSPASRADAEAVIELLGCHSAVVEISAQVDAYFTNELVPVEAEEAKTRNRRGNKMARERMTILYDFSEHLGALVLGTSNKTELLLGYGTLHGDMASAVNPIGDLYKTQVRQLAAQLDVPRSILDKPPTADLFEGQTDESQLGFAYDAIDRVLIHLIERRRPPEQVIALGFDESLVRRVMTMVQRSQFKRRLPVIAKVSERTIDRDFRYSRDWCY